jgi:hypothetical protein
MADRPIIIALIILAAIAALVLAIVRAPGCAVIEAERVGGLKMFEKCLQTKP